MKVTVSNEPIHLEIEWPTHRDDIVSALVSEGYTVTVKPIMKKWPNNVKDIDYFSIDAVKETEIEMEDKT